MKLTEQCLTPASARLNVNCLLPPPRFPGGFGALPRKPAPAVPFSQKHCPSACLHAVQAVRQAVPGVLGTEGSAVPVVAGQMPEPQR